MAVNPNYVPWLSILGVIGAGLGFAVGKFIPSLGQDPMVPAMYGLCAGVVTGFIVRIVLRKRYQPRPPDAGQDYQAGEHDAP